MNSELHDSDQSDGLAALTTFPFPCPNCDRPITTAQLFCSELCKQEAKYVRYARACRADGRDRLPDIQEALQIRRAMILGGGYPEEERRLSPEVRQAVIERDGGRCQVCGAPGTQIDHISGNSADLDNLQLLCSACHSEKTQSTFVSITLETHPEEWAKAMALRDRIEASVPQRLCDDHERWSQLWQRVLAERRRVVRELGDMEEEPVRVNQEVAAFVESVELNELVDFDDMSDGEQAEYLALLNGGGDPDWLTAFFNDEEGLLG